MFAPVSPQWQDETAGLLNLPQPTAHVWQNASTQPLPRRKPRRLRDVLGDGNCLPRSISVAITGNEDAYAELRKRVTTFLAARGVDAAEMEKMAEDGKWMTDREIEGFALLLGVPIYSIVKGLNRSWTYHRYPHPNGEHVREEGAIYIANIPTNKHFQVVLGKLLTS